MLQLHPGRGDEPLEASLEICNLDDTPEYDALSYMWGPKEPKHSIQVDNEPFLLRPNIYSFLLRLRLPDRPRRLWLDAVCIDQNNIEERGHQVSLMRDIYRLCRECLAWLGESEDRGGEVIEILRRSPVDAQGMADLNNLIGQLYHARLTDAFKKFLCHPYWSRVWMIQETTLPDKVTVHCGSFSCLLDNVPTQVRGRMFELFQQDPVRYKQWLSVFRTVQDTSYVVRTPIVNSQIMEHRCSDSGRPYVNFPSLVGYAQRGAQECCLGFIRVQSESRWEAVVVKETDGLPKDHGDVRIKTPSETSPRSAFSISNSLSLSTVSPQYFSVDDFNPEDAFRAIEAVFWCMKSTKSEQLLEERRRHSAATNHRFSSVDFRNFLENADRWHCTDIRDRIFGVLGVFQTWPQSYPFRADYRLSPRDLMLEVVNYCRPTDPFKLAIRLRSALRVDRWDGKTKCGPNDATSITVMSRIAWPLSSFSGGDVRFRPHEVDHYRAVLLRRLDLGPTVPAFRYLMQQNEDLRPSDELVSVGDAGVVIGVRKTKGSSVTTNTYECVGIGFDLTFETEPGQVYLDMADSVVDYEPIGSSDNDVDSPVARASRPIDPVDQFRPLHYLPNLSIQEAAAADIGDDGTPILWWIQLPIDLFWYVYEREEQRRATVGCEVEVDETVDYDRNSSCQDDDFSSGVASLYGINPSLSERE